MTKLRTKSSTRGWLIKERVWKVEVIFDWDADEHEVDDDAVIVESSSCIFSGVLKYFAV